MTPSPLAPARSQDPVVVVGAGPVGQTAALLLARWGVPVVVLDGRPERDLVGSKALVQQRDVIDIWSAVGAGDQIAAEGLTWSTSRTFFRDVELFATRWLDGGASPLPAFVNISQTRTESLLDERIAASPLVELHWGHEVVGLSQDPGGVSITCRTPGSGDVVVRGSHVVACGGSRGAALRTLLDVTFDGESFTDPFLICDIRTDLGDWSHERRFWFDPVWNPGRQVLVHPCPGSTYRIDWQVAPGFDLEAQERAGALDRRIRMIVGDADYEIVWKSVYRFHARVASRFRRGRVLLAGDLAHLLSPFGARGLNSGVQDAENAAWKIAFARNGWGDEDVLLESYHDERLAAARENIAVSTATMDFLVPRDEPAVAHQLDVLTRAVDDPSVHRDVDSGRLAEPFWYDGSALVTPDDTRPRPGRPPRGEYPPPAPGVLVPDFGCAAPGRPGVTRFRQLVRDGLLVVSVASPEDEEALREALAAVAAPCAFVHVDTLTADGAARRILGVRDGELWLLRPDGHVAAVCTSPEALREAAARCLALPAPTSAGGAQGALAD